MPTLKFDVKMTDAGLEALEQICNALDRIEQRIREINEAAKELKETMPSVWWDNPWWVTPSTTPIDHSGTYWTWDRITKTKGEADE